MLCLAVKANAYGHGIIRVAKIAAEEGIEYLSVATVDEALELREAGSSTPILLYSLPIPEEFPDVVHHGITPMVVDLDLVRGFETEAERQKRTLSVHLKIDTGMGRIGCAPQDAGEIAEYVSHSPHLALAGVSTHFAASDSEDREFTEGQIAKFNGALAAIRGRGVEPGIVNAANSGGIIGYGGAWYDMIRPGILAYGYPPAPHPSDPVDVKPVMELQSQVVFIKKVPAGTPVSYGMTWRSPRETFIGTIPIGYGDGYNRLLSNKAHVLIGDRRYPVVGRVCMDQIMIDLGPHCTVERFSTAILFGPQKDAPDADELAELCGTISYEITCAISKRVPRIYSGEARH